MPPSCPHSVALIKPQAIHSFISTISHPSTYRDIYSSTLLPLLPCIADIKRDDNRVVSFPVPGLKVVELDRTGVLKSFL